MIHTFWNTPCSAQHPLPTYLVTHSYRPLLKGSKCNYSPPLKKNIKINSKLKLLMLLIYEKIHKKQKETLHCFYKHKQMETLRYFSINILLSTEKNEYKFPPHHCLHHYFFRFTCSKGLYVFKNIFKKKCNFKHLLLIAIYV